MLCLLDVLILTPISPPYDHFFFNKGNVNLSLAQV